MQILKRLTDTFSDSRLQLKPVFANLLNYGLAPSFQPEIVDLTSVIDIFMRLTALAASFILSISDKSDLAFITAIRDVGFQSESFQSEHFQLKSWYSLEFLHL